MRTIKLTLLFFILLITSKAQAQMAAAKELPPKFKVEVTLNASVDKVWEYFQEKEVYKKMTGAKTFEIRGMYIDSPIKVVGRDGTPREQHISAIIEQRHMISFFVTKSEYLKDDTWVYNFQVKPKGENQCTVEMKVYNGYDPITEALEKNMRKEFEHMKKYLAKTFK